MKAYFKEKNRKHPYDNRVKSHTEMMRQCYRVRMEKVQREKSCGNAARMIFTL